MKGLKKIALASAIAAVAAGAQAELKALDDSTMGELTGQAGLTIDVETKWSIGEFAYVDAGAVVLKGISMGGNSNEGTNSMLDNIRITLDVAGATAADNTLAYGFSEVKGLAAVHVGGFGNTDTGMQAAAAGFGTQTGASIDVASGDVIDDERVYGDGDLKLHFGFTDAWQKGGGFAAYAVGAGADGSGGTTDMTNLTYAAAREIASTAVDFEFQIDAIAIADSTYGDAAGTRLGTEVIQKTDHVTGLDTDAGADTTTTLISDLSMKGYLGPVDILIENNGNGFTSTDAARDGWLAATTGAARQSGDADSKIHWDTFVKVTDLDLYIDIAGVMLEDIKIHNVRGDITTLDGTASFGFAHSKRDIYAVKDAVLNLETLSAPTGANAPGYVDGIAINTQFKGDIDIGALSFGDTGTSIGSIYMTDVTSTTNWTISAN
ncbi:MAG: DUF6160 family protein [Oleiphilus sp.]